MGIDRVNKSGGANGRPMEAIVVDYESKPDIGRRKAEKLTLEDKVDVGLHAMRSSSSGTLLAGGRHFTTLVINIRDLCIPAFSNASFKICPAAPTNGFPSSSSFLPGASPININFADNCPSPGTAFFLLRESLQSGQPMTSVAIFSNESFGTLRVAIYLDMCYIACKDFI